jgi:hypothetical protein
MCVKVWFSGWWGEVLFHNCKGIGKMGVMNKVGITDYSVSGACGGIRCSGGKVGRGEEGKEKKRGDNRRNKRKKIGGQKRK